MMMIDPHPHLTACAVQLQTHRVAYDQYLVATHEGANRVAYVYAKNAAHWHYLAAKALAERPAAVAGQPYFISNGDDGVVTVKVMRDGIIAHRTKPLLRTITLTETVRRGT
jgi:hypothetical protein